MGVQTVGRIFSDLQTLNRLKILLRGRKGISDEQERNTGQNFISNYALRS